MAKINDVVTSQFQFEEQAVVPGTPALNVVRVYAKDDKKLYAKDDTGTERPLQGVSTFIDLSDTPASYTTQAGKAATVNVEETGLEFTAVETPTGAQAKVDAHADLTVPHSATAAATPNRLMLRDAAGRAQVVAPSAAADIARKDTVDAVQTNLTAHAGATTDIHGVGVSTVESVAGAQAKVNAHADLTNNPHATTAAQVGLGNVANVKQAPLVLTINEQTGANYTLVLTDGNGVLVDMNSATAQTLTVPTNASVAFGIGTQLLIRQKGAGQVTIAPATGVTLQSADGELKLRKQYSIAGLIKLAADTWAVFGDVVV